MGSHGITKAAIARKVENKFVYLDNMICNMIVDTVFDEIKAAVARGDRVIIQNFGGFTKSLPKRGDYTPHTLKALRAPKKPRIKFRPSPDFRQLLKTYDSNNGRPYTRKFPTRIDGDIGGESL